MDLINGDNEIDSRRLESLHSSRNDENDERLFDVIDGSKMHSGDTATGESTTQKGVGPIQYESFDFAQHDDGKLPQ